MTSEHERAFDLFGSRVRLLVGPPAEPGLPDPPVAAVGAEVLLRHVHDRLTRFDPASELSRLNADPRPEVPVSTLLAAAVSAALWAARRSGGYVDPVLLDRLEDAGYRDSRAGRTPGPLAEALESAPPARPASPAADQRWRMVEVDSEAGVVRRPPGLRIDLGGSGKGWAADLVAGRLRGYETFAVDAGGDLRIGGARLAERRTGVDHPLRAGEAAVLGITVGAVATSGLRTRVWRTGAGFSHHLIDPSTGVPAWTGVAQATALAPTALEAETLAKAALLAGPIEGRRVLERGGGVRVLYVGEVVVAGDPPLLDSAPRRHEVAA